MFKRHPVYRWNRASRASAPQAKCLPNIPADALLERAVVSQVFQSIRLGMPSRWAWVSPSRLALWSAAEGLPWC